MNRSTKISLFFKELFHSYMRVCFQLDAIVREHLVIYLVFCLDVAQSHMNVHPLKLEFHIQAKN